MHGIGITPSWENLEKLSQVCDSIWTKNFFRFNFESLSKICEFVKSELAVLYAG